MTAATAPGTANQASSRSTQKQRTLASIGHSPRDGPKALERASNVKLLGYNTLVPKTKTSQDEPNRLLNAQRRTSHRFTKPRPIHSKELTEAGSGLRPLVPRHGATSSLVSTGTAELLDARISGEPAPQESLGDVEHRRQHSLQQYVHGQVRTSGQASPAFARGQ